MSCRLQPFFFFFIEIVSCHKQQYVKNTNTIFLITVCQTRVTLRLPVSEKGADDIPGVFGNVHIVWEVERVFMVHDLAVRSHQRVGVEGSVA